MNAFAERMAHMRNTKKSKKPDLSPIHPPKKICPMMSNGQDKVACTSDCMLYRQKKSGSSFVCPFQELPTLSWNMKVLVNLGNE